MSVTLRKRKNNDGTFTPFLDIYNGPGNRHCEFLKNLKLPSGSSPADRQTKKENWELAKKIHAARSQELSANDYSIASDLAKKVIVKDWMDSYSKKYDKADIRVIEGVIKRFETFLAENKLSGLLMKDFSESIALQFRDKLISSCAGEGAKSYYARFRKIVKQAKREKLLLNNPCEFLRPPKGDAKVKDVLTFDELQKIAKTDTDAVEVKRAFLFCSVTGLRFCDAKALIWNQIDFKDRIMKVLQAKTGKFKEFPLNETAVALIGKEKNKKDVIFDLPTANGCNKSLQSLVDRAKIKKKITWHCARHGYGTNLIYNGTDIYTTSQLLGHESLAHTKRYVRASREMNQKAVDSLPAIKL